MADAVAELFRATADDLYRYARTLPLGNTAQPGDLVQETFHSALVSWAASRLGERDLPAQRRWLFRVLKNKAVDGWRKDKNILLGHELADDSAGQLADVTQHQALCSVVLQKCWRAIETMPVDRQRTVFLRWNEGWTAAEIAEWLGITPSTVRSHIWHAREQLRREVGMDLPFQNDPHMPGVTQRWGR